MYRQGILHPELASWVARLGHHDYLLLTDAGYPYLKDIPRIDLGFAPGQPSFLSVAEVLIAALPIEKVWLARELPAQNPNVYEGFKRLVTHIPLDFIESHDLFKERSRQAMLMVRTGEFTPFANCLIECGVAFGA